MASGPINSWEIDGETVETETLFWGAPKSLGETVETVRDFILGGSKNQRHLLLEGKL